MSFCLSIVSAYSVKITWENKLSKYNRCVKRIKHADNAIQRINNKHKDLQKNAT